MKRFEQAATALRTAGHPGIADMLRQRGQRRNLPGRLDEMFKVLAALQLRVPSRYVFDTGVSLLPVERGVCFVPERCGGDAACRCVSSCCGLLHACADARVCRTSRNRTAAWTCRATMRRMTG